MYMSGEMIGQLILWLIVAVVVIAIVFPARSSRFMGAFATTIGP